MSEPLDLDAIRKREQAATEGPWDPAFVASAIAISGSFYNGELISVSEYHEDAEFVAHAREDIPALLAEVTRLRAELDAEREGHREQRAADWDEGYESALDTVTTAMETGEKTPRRNPYREPTP